MTDAKRCPQCGDELAADAPAGICPRCLLSAGMASNTSIGGQRSDEAPTTPLPGSSRFVPPPPQELARHFPQLDVLELIGAGGMGAVYKARQPGLDRLVAVKILPPEVGADPSFAQRFMREAQALARLGHQHIVSVYDFGVAGGLYYFIMEYVDGANLRHLIKTHGLKSTEALAIVPQICEALQFAHDEGVVHRDIKPENILLDKRGRVKIADFGLARLLGASAPEISLTGTNQVLGTLHYMAPEQIQGLRTVDHRADIYSLGVVFYEMLTGELPLGRFAPPSQKVEVDVRLDEVVLRSLESEPQRRYQQASQVKTDLDRISHDSAAAKFVRQEDSAVADLHSDSDSAVTNTAAVRSIQKLANALLVVGGVGLVAMIALTIWLPMGGVERLFPVRDAHGGEIRGSSIVWTTIALTGMYALVAVPHALIVIAAALLLRNGKAYWLAVAACILAALPITFVFPIGLPIGLWGLTVLTSPKVRAIFARVDSAEQKTPSERLFWPAIGLLVAAIIDGVQALLLIVASIEMVLTNDANRAIEPSILGIVALAMGVVRLFGGMQMLKLKSRALCTFASVTSLLPVSFGSFVGIPAGIWALIVLARSDVKEAFLANATIANDDETRRSDFSARGVGTPVTPAPLAGRPEGVHEREFGSPARPGADLDEEERQRTAELAERPPYWLEFGAMGLFTLGWIFAGAMWNYRWPGLWVAIAVMAAITYGVVRWKVAYVPALHAELSRQSRIRRGFALSAGLILFVLAMFLLVAAQTYALDFFHSYVFRSFNFEEKEQTVRYAVRLAKLQGLGKDAIVSPGGWGRADSSITLPWLSSLFNGWLGFAFLFWSVSTVIDTRRFRGSWKYALAPSLAISFACFVMLPGAQAIRTLAMGLKTSSVPPFEFRCAASNDQVAAVINRWSEKMGYAGGSYYIEIVEQQKTVGKVYVVDLSQNSQFDRYRLSWRNGVWCPRPALSIACVTTNDPIQAYVHVELPMQKVGSPEESLWPKLLDGLEAEILAASETENKDKLEK